jgi:hypothetical protein
MHCRLSARATFLLRHADQGTGGSPLHDVERDFGGRLLRRGDQTTAKRLRWAPRSGFVGRLLRLEFSTAEGRAP